MTNSYDSRSYRSKTGRGKPFCLRSILNRVNHFYRLFEENTKHKFLLISTNQFCQCHWNWNDITFTIQVPKQQLSITNVSKVICKNFNFTCYLPSKVSTVYVKKNTQLVANVKKVTLKDVNVNRSKKARAQNFVVLLGHNK